MHYFLTYKQAPDDKQHRVSIPQVYDRDEAQHMIALSLSDYQAHFPGRGNSPEQGSSA